MKKGNEASPSIILAGRALLVKMLIPLAPCCVFDSKFEYLCILTLSRYWNAKGDEASPPTLHVFVQFSNVFLPTNLYNGKRKICTINSTFTRQNMVAMFCIRLTAGNKL